MQTTAYAFDENHLNVSAQSLLDAADLQSLAANGVPSREFGEPWFLFWGVLNPVQDRAELMGPLRFNISIGVYMCSQSIFCCGSPSASNLLPNRGAEGRHQVSHTVSESHSTSWQGRGWILSLTPFVGACGQPTKLGLFP